MYVEYQWSKDPSKNQQQSRLYSDTNCTVQEIVSSYKKQMQKTILRSFLLFLKIVFFIFYLAKIFNSTKPTTLRQ